MGTSTSAGYKSSYTGDQIDAAIAQVNTNKTDIENLKKSISQNYIDTTHANLLALISNNKLIPCAWYHITDYCANYGLFVMANTTNSITGIAYPDVNNGALYYEYDIYTDYPNSEFLYPSKGSVKRGFYLNNNILSYDFYNSKLPTDINNSFDCSCDMLNVNTHNTLSAIFNSNYHCKVDSGCANIIFLENCAYIHVGQGCTDINFGLNCVGIDIKQCSNLINFDDDCTNIKIGQGCTDISFASQTNNVTIMPVVCHLIVTSDMSNSVISYNPNTDTINIIRD